MATQTFNASGTWVAPAGVTSVTAECWGSGAHGLDGSAFAGGNGGGGGAYASKVTTVTPGNSYTVTVDTANNNGSTWFDSASVVDADSAFLNAGGTAAASTGDTVRSGGDGGTNIIMDTGGAGGGGSATAGAAGNAGASPSGSTGGAGGTGEGNGGNGGDDGANGVAGNAPGGGGGGGGRNGTAGVGKDGRVTLTWTAPATDDDDLILLPFLA